MAPTKCPVLIFETTLGSVESLRSIENTENASMAFISPKPGMDMVSFSIPFFISSEP